MAQLSIAGCTKMLFLTLYTVSQSANYPHIAFATRTEI